MVIAINGKTMRAPRRADGRQVHLLSALDTSTGVVLAQVAQRFGDRATFAVEVGAIDPPALCAVDLWAAGKRLTVDDSVAFVPFLCRAMRSTAARVRRRDVAPCPFPDRSPEEISRLLHADDMVF